MMEKIVDHEERIVKRKQDLEWEHEKLRQEQANILKEIEFLSRGE